MVSQSIATTLGLFTGNLSMCQFRSLLWPSQGGGAAAQTVEAGALLHCMVLRCVCTAAISGLCLKCSMCFPTDIKCYGPLWFSCLLEMHIILFYVLELFYGKVKGSGRLFCNLFTLVSILYLFCTSVLFTAYAVILNSCYISSRR